MSSPSESHPGTLVPRSHPTSVEWTLDEPKSSALVVDGIDHVRNPHPRCPVALLLDTSASMQGAPIAELQEAVAQFLREVAADELALLSVELAIYSVGGEVRNPLAFGAPLEVAAEAAPVLSAAGQTPLGAAVTQAMQAIRQRQAVYARNSIPAYRPWVVIMSDGEPNDPEWEKAAAALCARSNDSKWNVFCIAIGGNANTSQLQKFSAAPVQRLAGLKFAALFRWLSDSLKAVSRSSTGGAVRSLPATTAWTFTP